MHLVETRIPLELFAGELACKRITSDQLNDLKDQLDVLKEKKHHTEKAAYTFARLELKFHRSVYKATQNPELAKLLQQLHDKCARVWYCLASGNDDVSFGLNDLCVLLDALSSKNVSLIKKTIRKHLNGFIAEVEKRVNS